MTSRRLVAELCAVLAFGPTFAAADAVLEWNEIMIELVQDQPPPLQNRFAAIAALAVFEAVNAVTGDYGPHLGTVPAMPGASADAAAVSAAHRVLRYYFPDRAGPLDAARATSLARIPDGSAKSGGIAVGEAAAAAMIAARADDGSEPPESYLPTSLNAGEWQLTADCPPTGGFFLHWRNVAPFALRRPDQFRSDPPPTLTSGRYTWAYKEVKAVGGRESSERPQDRTNVARLYEVSSDAALWNPIARQLATAARRSLSQNSRTFALLNMALSDGGVAVMDTKYHYNFWRPETSIVGAETDGNERTVADSSYAPFISAPCFPSYPSGHATTSYAAREVLERTFGAEQDHSITVSHPAVSDVTLEYAKLSEITFDIDDARVYGGIHFRFDQEEGFRQGRHVGAYIFTHSLKPVRRCTCDDEEYDE
jgi:hypothetical protein